MRLHPRPRLALLGTALAASVVLSVTLGAGAAWAATSLISQCSVNLRSSASTTATVVAVIPTGALVGATDTVSGSSWSASCGGSNVAGSSWYKITSVNGTSTSSLYGMSAVYAATGLFKAAPAPPPSGSRLEGVDVSHWQGTINWPSVAAAGKRFAIMKATESTTYADSSYPTNHSGARANGIRAGAYHFAQPSTTSGDAVAEADWFVSHANLLPGDLVPALDLEVANGLGTSTLQAWVKSWLDEVYKKTGTRAMIYTSPSFWRTYMGDTSSFATAGYTVLWVAHWFVTSPSVPGNNWGGNSWTFWQYDDCGSVSGIGGCVDLDRYNGTDFTRVTYGSDFNLATSPTPVSIKQGASTSIAVSIDRTWFTLPVTLSVSGAPAGTTATLDATSTTGSSVNLTFATVAGATPTPVGTYTLTVSATANGTTRTTPVIVSVTDGIAPTVTAPTSKLFFVSYVAANGMPGRTGWSGTDPSGISAYTLEEQVNAGTWTTVALSPTTVTAAGQHWTFNDTHRFRVRATDGAGNTTAWQYGAPFKVAFSQDTSSAMHYSGSWGITNTVYAYGGTLHYANAAGASVSQTFTGSGVAWVAYKGPNRGSANVYVDGVLAATVSLYAATYASKAVVFTKTWSTNATHTIKVVVVGTAGHPRVDLDGFVRFVLS